MKKALLIFALTFVALGASAQNQRVKVTSAAEGDLPFSYIYINSKIFGAADKNAQVMIPRAQLKDGDTISATHIGFRKGMIIYKGPKSNGYTINLKADELDKITIYGRKETRQQFHDIEPKPQFVAIPQDFTFRVVLDINGKEYLRGNFYCGGYHCGPHKIYLELDDKYTPLLQDKCHAEFISEFAIYLIAHTFNVAVKGITTDRMMIEALGIKLSKTAESDNTRAFLLAQGKDNPDPYLEMSEVFFDVNTATNMVESARMLFQFDIGMEKLSASYAYGTQSFDMGGFYTRQDVRYPEVIESTYTMKDGTVYTMDIYDTRLTHKDKPQKFSKHNSINVYKYKIHDALISHPQQIQKIQQ